MSFRTGTDADTFVVELPSFNYAGGFNPFGTATDSTPNFTGEDFGSRGSKLKQLLDQGYTLEAAKAIANADTIDADDDERFYDIIDKYNDPEFLRQKLDLKNEFEAERMAQAAPYNLMYQIPRTLTQAAILPATVALGSAKTATDALARMGGINIVGGALNPNAGGYF